MKLAYSDIKLAIRLDPENLEIIKYYNQIINLIKKYIQD